MSEEELQIEEREVLSSIYEGDDHFKEVSPNTFQYKFGEEDSPKSFLIEIKWGDKYPNEVPTIDLDLFYNRNLTSSQKGEIMKFILTEAEQYIGMSMTYTLFESIKEHMDNFSIDHVPETNNDDFANLVITEDVEEPVKKTVRKEILTKAQKRRQWHKLDGKGEKPRGWDWVDIVKHLSQTGGKDNNNYCPGS